MTKSEIFKKAHATAKQIIDTCSSYKAAFALALMEVYQSLKTSSTKDKLLNLGLSVWGHEFGKDRIYINEPHYEAVFGLKISRYNTGNVMSAYLNGEKISNSKAKKLISEKIYFCIKTNAFIGTEMNSII